MCRSRRKFCGQKEFSNSFYGCFYGCCSQNISLVLYTSYHHSSSLSTSTPGLDLKTGDSSVPTLCSTQTLKGLMEHLRRNSLKRSFCMDQGLWRIAELFVDLDTRACNITCWCMEINRIHFQIAEWTREFHPSVKDLRSMPSCECSKSLTRGWESFVPSTMWWLFFSHAFLFSQNFHLSVIFSEQSTVSWHSFLW